MIERTSQEEIWAPKAGVFGVRHNSLLSNSNLTKKQKNTDKFLYCSMKISIFKILSDDILFSPENSYRGISLLHSTCYLINTHWMSEIHWRGNWESEVTQWSLLAHLIEGSLAPKLNSASSVFRWRLWNQRGSQHPWPGHPPKSKSTRLEPDPRNQILLVPSSILWSSKDLRTTQ